MKHLIKIESTSHGVLGVRHAGRDQQYCEAGEQVILNWQPDAKWGLQEAHYTDGDGNVTPIDLTRVKVNGKDVVVFTMPNANITVGGTFKRFVIDDWTEGIGEEKSIVEKVAELAAKIEALESHEYVELFIGAGEDSSFVWPFETTLLSEIEFLGYSAPNMVDSYKILKSGLTIQNYNASEFSEYYDDDYGWWGDIQSLEKGKWYTISYASIAVGFLAHVYIRPRQQ